MVPLAEMPALIAELLAFDGSPRRGRGDGGAGLRRRPRARLLRERLRDAHRRSGGAAHRRALRHHGPDRDPARDRLSVAYAVGQPFIGPYGDAVGKVRVIRWCVAILVVGHAICAIAPSFETLLLLRGLTGIAGGGIIPVCLAVVGDRIPIERRQIVMGRFLTMLIIGQMAGATSAGLSPTRSRGGRASRPPPWSRSRPASRSPIRGFATSIRRARSGSANCRRATASCSRTRRPRSSTPS